MLWRRSNKVALQSAARCVNLKKVCTNALERLLKRSFVSPAQNNEYVVLATLKRAASELSSSQRKLFKIDDKVGIAISGLTADGTAATKALRGDCMTHKFTFDSQVDVGRLAARVADKSQASLACYQASDNHFCFSAYTPLDLLIMVQVCTQRSGSRPSGVGMLIAGADEQGCHLYQTCPSGNLYTHVAAAIGKTRPQTLPPTRAPLSCTLISSLETSLHGSPCRPHSLAQS